MKVGAFWFSTVATSPVEMARAVEERGIESLWVCEHSHAPAPPAVYTAPDGNQLAWYYRELTDPLITLAAAAAVTTRLLLGTAILIASQRDPITTAKEVATLDHLAGGRLELGVGAGWDGDELAAHGTNPKLRYRELKLRVQLMRRLWSGEPVDLGLPELRPVAQLPGPYQRPHPHLLIAGNGPGALTRVLAYGNGWLATFAHPDLPLAMARVREIRAEGQTLPVTVIAGGAGDRELNGYAELGVDRALVAVRAGDWGETAQRLDRIADLSRRLSGETLVQC